jgi:hypothetical protein
MLKEPVKESQRISKGVEVHARVLSELGLG